MINGGIIRCWSISNVVHAVRRCCWGKSIWRRLPRRSWAKWNRRSPPSDRLSGRLPSRGCFHPRSAPRRWNRSGGYRGHCLLDVLSELRRQLHTTRNRPGMPALPGFGDLWSPELRRTPCLRSGYLAILWCCSRNYVAMLRFSCGGSAKPRKIENDRKCTAPRSGNVFPAGVRSIFSPSDFTSRLLHSPVGGIQRR